jgi:dTMP kinase
MPTRGRFITFEGIEGCGKTTQLKMLAEHLRGQGRQVLSCREPGGTPLGERVRSLLLDPASVICDEAEALLFAASRAQLLRQVILPALEEGTDVLCDRFVDSSIAYQGNARGLGVEAVIRANRMAVGDHWPDVTVLVDVAVEVGLDRARSRALFDRIEQEDLDFHGRVRDGYLQTAKSDWAGNRFVIVDGHGTPEEVFVRVLEAAT